MDDSLLKYKTSSRFRIFSTFEEYLQEQILIYAQDEDFNLFCQFISNSKLKPDLVILKMKESSISSLPFYVNYLFFNFKIDGFKVLVSRFNEEQDKENKIVIYNCVRLLINHLELKDLLYVVDQGVLNILVGEYGKEKVLPIEDLGLSNFHLKFLGYFTFEEMANMSMAQLKTFIDKDIGVMKIITMCTENIFNLEDILSKDKYLRFYIENCTINIDLLKKLKSNYNPYTLYLLFDKLRNDEFYCKTRLSKLTPAKRTFLFILFSRDDEWLKKYATEKLLFLNFKPKDERQILREINQTGQKFFHFSEVQQLNKFIPKEKKDDLKEIDSFLFEKSMAKILEKCIEEGMNVIIYNWLSKKEIYFSLVVKRFPWLNDFHKCAPENMIKRSQMAEDILISDNKSVLMVYLEQKRVLVDFREIGEIVYDFSVEWLKMFIEENHNRIKQIEKDDYKETIITYLQNNNDKDIVIIVNHNKHSILQKVLDDLSLNSSNNAVTIKKPITVCPDEEYLIKIYENRSLLKDFNKSFKQKAIHSFRRPGVLNKFILSYIHDLEGCAMVIASVFRESYHVKNFLRKITFVIENESLLISFINHFLRFVKSKVPLYLIRKWADSIDPIVLAGKVNVFGLGTLIDNYYSEDLKKGILIRGYSYLIQKRYCSKKGFKRIEDGDIVFYYENLFSNVIEIKYQMQIYKYGYSEQQEFFKEMQSFANSNCPLRKALVLRCINILGFDVDYKKTRIKDQKLCNLFIENPLGHIHLLHKLVQINFKPNKPTVYKLINFLRKARDAKEKSILEVIKLFPIDKEVIIYILSNFEFFSYDTKLSLVIIFKGPVDTEIFEKYCEVIKNEKDYGVLKTILVNLKDRKVYFPIIEEWKSNLKLTKLLIRIYPLGMKDKKYYFEIFKKCNEEEKKMIQEVYKI